MGPKRIICLTEETTELLYLLGEQERIVGISAYSVRPPQAKKEKPKVSAFISGNVKRIKELKPDLIIGFSDIQSELARDLINEGLNVLITNQRNLNEIFDTIQLIGSIVGKLKETEQLVDRYKIELEKLSNLSKGKYRPRVFFQEWDHPIITGICWVSELLEILGADDCFGYLKDKALAKDRIVTLQQVEAASPEVIIGSWCGKPMDWNWIRSREEWKDCPAIIHDKIFEVDPSIILQPGPALFECGMQELSKIIEVSRTEERIET
ncbi:cobalamin-binding protein [Leptospira perolatii]|uniref:Cobalamin-binding protein n=1 Tax=Leptospira perolatii TaxID=2023191 RepID=A0A2M9ZKX6_9LEPT|nr:cobalamin-binding protein [Leptospira perolatii]PJZ72730.1 cobalamin-binding protein [Leptospira perolatii]